jgi:hypothetical protein
MPVGLAGDFLLGDKPFLLVRGGSSGPRSWRKTGQSDSTARRLAESQGYGALPDEQDHPEVWNDWSGGYGYAYRSPDAPNTYHWGENIDARFPGQLVHAQAPRMLPSGTASFNTNVEYFLDLTRNTVGGVGPYKEPAAGSGDLLLIGRGFIERLTPVTESSFAAFGVTNDTFVYSGRPATYGTHYYVGRVGAGQFAQGHQVNPTSISTGSLPANAFVTAGNRMWRAFGGALGGRSTKLQSIAVDDTNLVLSAGNYSATLNVGDGSSAIKDMIELGEQLFVGMNTGLYAGDQSGTFYNVLSELRNQVHEDNCRDLAVYNGQVIVPHFTGLYAYQPSDATAIVREIGPAGKTSNKSPVRGYVRAVRNLGPWLYAGLWTGSQSYLLAGREAPNGQPWVWHTLQRLPHVARVHRIHFDGITTNSANNALLPNRAWIATDATTALNGTAPVYYWPIPANNDNPILEALPFSANYTGSARIDLGSTDWGAPATPKVWRSVEVWAENLASGAIYGDVYYTVDSGTRTLLGRVQDSPRSILYFPTEDAGGSFVTGQSIALSLESFTGSVNTTPVYRSLVLRGALRARSSSVIEARVRVADDLQDRNGTPMRPAAVMLQELRAMADGATPRRLVDLAGATSWVAVLPPIEETELWQEGVDTPEIVAGVRMAVLDFSAT